MDPDPLDPASGRLDPGRLAPATLAVHLGRPARSPGSPVNPPVELASTFHSYGSVGEAVYGRDDNATWAAFEEVLGGLEGGRALAFGSGMAAISAVLSTVPVGGWVVVAADAYTGTHLFLQDAAARGRLLVRVVDATDVAATLAVCAAVSQSPHRRVGGEASAGLLWLESPSNPLLSVASLPDLIDGAHRLGFTVAVDNTFATPLLQRPLDLGADVVVHSVSKLLAGHSDLVMGATVTRSTSLVEQLTTRRSLHGAVPGPLETFLALRGIRTLAVRLERAQATAAVLAARLASRAGVVDVRYPGLPGHPGHALAARQMRGFGTMMSFSVAGGPGPEAAPTELAEAVCRSVRLVTAATSLGGVETLIRAMASHPGLPPSLLRLSVGLEDVEDLWADLDRALAAAGVG